MEDIEAKLLKYKQITDNLMNSIKEDDEEGFLRFLGEKQLIIDSINEIKYEPNQFKKISEELKLPEQDKELLNLVDEKKISIKEKISEINEQKNAISAYNRGFSGYNLINKKI